MKGEELAGVQWPDGYRYLAPKGSWFNIKYLIDRDWADDRVVLYFPQLSPAQLKQEFPLMDLLKANMEYHDQDYAAFIQQYNAKGSVAKFFNVKDPRELEVPETKKKSKKGKAKATPTPTLTKVGT